MYIERINQYKHQLKRLQKANGLPEQDLKTRYKKSYQDIRESVRKETPEIIKILAFGGCKSAGGPRWCPTLRRLPYTHGAGIAART